MWITKYISKSSKGKEGTSLGSVVHSGGGTVEVNASMFHRNLQTVAPFGIAWVPPSGENAVVTDMDSMQVCMGVLSPKSKELSPGEIRLFSNGGASVTLKNDGRILLEGRFFLNGKEVTF